LLLLAKWSGHSRYCPNPKGEFIGYELRAAERRLSERTKDASTCRIQDHYYCPPLAAPLTSQGGDKGGDGGLSRPFKNPDGYGLTDKVTISPQRSITSMTSGII